MPTTRRAGRIDRWALSRSRSLPRISRASVLPAVFKASSNSLSVATRSSCHHPPAATPSHRRPTRPTIHGIARAVEKALERISTEWHGWEETAMRRY
ncbi:protein of unknown function (plasmid) [Azospirillum baldaniorum]|uniref:Uncharacterized protein n=1 Tax=Azospirillum baldaniorum TaxID=1064539 RepID=A0A9P1NQ86_9PROT|nr:protein of unknown function [Azospirillum baldaniorum]